MGWQWRNLVAWAHFFRGWRQATKAHNPFQIQLYMAPGPLVYQSNNRFLEIAPDH